ncbi:hypothetical protein O2K51_00735 [Apibacter raozihei]|uniref:hypothetical protein n=1 Tax=Apibacter raozihei TaxID=2500547 RepID=UPI000FE3946B|nr:hypothetical protein [Apibacter raozihei]
MTDILLQNNFTTNFLRESFAKLFNIKYNEIDIQDFDFLDGNNNLKLKIFGFVNLVKGDFSMQLTYNILDKSIEYNEIDFLKNLSLELNTDILISDNSNIDPYYSILITKNNEIKKVSMDEKDVGDFISYHIIKIID